MNFIQYVYNSLTDYVAELKVTLQLCETDGSIVELLLQPPPLSISCERPEKAEAILQHTSRFNM